MHRRRSGERTIHAVDGDVNDDDGDVSEVEAVADVRRALEPRMLIAAVASTAIYIDDDYEKRADRREDFVRLVPLRSPLRVAAVAIL